MPDAARARVSREMFLAAFGSPLLGIDGWVLDRMTSLLEPEEHKAGQVLFRAGDPPDWLYFVREGTVQLAGSGRPAREIRGPSVVGMFDVILDRPRTMTAVTLEDRTLMKVRADEWMELLDDSFELARTAILRLGRAVAALEESAGGLASAAPDPPSLSPGDMSPAVRVAAQLEAPWFCDAGVQSLCDLALVMEPCHFAPGECVVDPGRRLDGRLFLIVTGGVERRRQRPDIVRRDRPGEVVLGAAALCESRTAWTAHATEETQALAFRFDDWLDLMEENFDLVRAALRGLVRQHEQLADESIAREGDLARAIQRPAPA